MKKNEFDVIANSFFEKWIITPSNIGGTIGSNIDVFIF